MRIYGKASAKETFEKISKIIDIPEGGDVKLESKVVDGEWQFTYQTPRTLRDDSYWVKNLTVVGLHEDDEDDMPFFLACPVCGAIVSKLELGDFSKELQDEKANIKASSNLASN